MDMRMFLAGVQSLAASVIGHVKQTFNFFSNPGPWKGGTPSRSKTLSARLKAEFRENNPGVSLDMHRYARRYQGVGMLRAKYPFSAKR